jgi:gamma-D-glutamyl-L-lysine dipeptidyl-peptidase
MQNIKTLKYPLLILFLWSCGNSQTGDITNKIKLLKQQYAPDARVAIWDIAWDGNSITGETDQEDAMLQLKNFMDSLKVSYSNEVLLLPEAVLEDKTRAIVTLSVANIRSAPKHSAELATQATLGTPLRVLKKSDSWYLVQTPDKYISWVDAAGIQLMTAEELSSWYDNDLLIYTSYQGFLYESPEAKAVVSDLVAGNLLASSKQNGDMIQINLPDGRTGWVKSEEVAPFEAWEKSRSLTPDNLIATAKQMMGVPYLWGGTSIKGMDCSGFTKTVYFLNGQIIPRDASQQVWEGETVDTSSNWDNLTVGDLLFFGEKGDDSKKERVVHVGMWIGNNSFIHARGRVRISSFDPKSPDYDAYELNRYLRTQRIIGNNTPNVNEVRTLFP